jgi:hypothetical protein
VSIRQAQTTILARIFDKPLSLIHKILDRPEFFIPAKEQAGYQSTPP